MTYATQCRQAERGKIMRHSLELQCVDCVWHARRGRGLSYQSARASVVCLIWRTSIVLSRPRVEKRPLLNSPTPPEAHIVNDPMTLLESGLAQSEVFWIYNDVYLHREVSRMGDTQNLIAIDNDILLFWIRIVKAFVSFSYFDKLVLWF